MTVDITFFQPVVTVAHQLVVRADVQNVHQHLCDWKQETNEAQRKVKEGVDALSKFVNPEILSRF